MPLQLPYLFALIIIHTGPLMYVMMSGVMQTIIAPHSAAITLQAIGITLNVLQI